MVSGLVLLLACSGDGQTLRESVDDEATADDSDDDDDDDDADESGDEGPDDRSDCVSGGPADDVDADGFTPAQGDCDDCSPQMNPGAYDFPGDERDEDCSGAPAEAGEEDCDGELAMNSGDARDAARAIGLCKFIDEDDAGWGVLQARFTNATGDGELDDPRMVGILPEFGAARPRAGASLLALSSGIARAVGQPDYSDFCDFFCDPEIMDCSRGDDPPPGYPKESSICEDFVSSHGGESGPVQVHNQSALEVKVRVPTNARSFTFDSVFYSLEYPHYICAYNDFFVVFQQPRPSGLEDDNIVFDANGDPIGVNTGLLAVCDPSQQLPDAPKQFACEQGTDLLRGTGYDKDENSCAFPGEGGAATGWLHTTSPVHGGQVITLRFAIWDTKDKTLDSTVLIDGFTWSVEKPEGSITVPL